MSRLFLAALAVVALNTWVLGAAIQPTLTGGFANGGLNNLVKYSYNTSTGTPSYAYATGSVPFAGLGNAGTSGVFNFTNNVTGSPGVGNQVGARQLEFSGSNVSFGADVHDLYAYGQFGAPLIQVSGKILVSLGSGNQADFYVATLTPTNLAAGDFFRVNTGGPTSLVQGSTYTLSGDVEFEFLVSSTVSTALSPILTSGVISVNILNVQAIPSGAVPEPASMAVFGLLCGCGVYGRLRSRKK
jgi:hypothetical protein